MPASLDKTDAFLTNAERILRESRLPEFTDDLRRAVAELDTLLG